MTTNTFSRYVAGFILLSIALGGCAAFRDDKRTAITSWPLPNTAKKQSINLVVNGKAWINEKEIPADKVQSNQLGPWRMQANQAYTESGLFSEVRLASEEPADLQADINIEQRAEFSETLSFILGLTFGLSSVIIPQKGTDTFIVTASFKDRAGHVLAASKQTETVATWTQLFFVFAMPFRDGPDTTATAALYDLHRALLQDFHQKHLRAGSARIDQVATR